MTDAELCLQAEALSGIGGWAFDGQTQGLHWTPQTFRLHGLDPGAPQPSLAQALALLTEADRGRVDRALHTAIEQRKGLDLRFALRLPGGREHALHCLAQFRPQPLGPGVLCGALQAAAAAQAAVAHQRSDPLEYAVAAAGVGVWELDMLTGEEVWSDLTLAMYGLPSGAPAPTRQRWREEFLHPDDRERVAQRGADFAATGRTYEMDYRIRRAGNGEIRWLHSRAAFAFGGKRRVLGITLDITERRRAEEAAHETAQLLDIAATQVGFGFGYRESDGEQGVWSPQLKRLFGLDPLAPTPRQSDVVQRICDRDRARVRKELALPIAPGAVREVEFDINAGSQGQPRTLMTRAVKLRGSAGRAARTYFAVVDLTEMRQQDRRMAELLDRLKMATEASGVGIWDHNELSGEVHWDAITKQHFGLAADATTPGREAYVALLHPADRERAMAEWDAAEGHSIDIEFRVLGKAGTERWLRSRGRIERDAQGRVVRRVGVCFDTTERRLAESALQARALAEQANAAKTDFLSRMSHELRTPLNAVLGFSQLMALDHEEPLTAAQLARVGHIQAAGWHLLALVDDVLDLAKIEARQSHLVFAPVPLAEVVHECLVMTAPQAQGREVTLRWHDSSHPVNVWADRKRLKQLLLNLISNAIKYNHIGGYVDVRGQALEDGQVRITVQDTGLGLPPERLPGLFEPFNRLGRESSGIEGTGIGLALCKLIVEQLGGEIAASSAAGQGSVFTVTLPSPPRNG